ERFLPPLTTLVTRLMEITWSLRSSPDASIRSIFPQFEVFNSKSSIRSSARFNRVLLFASLKIVCPRPTGCDGALPDSELETAFASRFSEILHPAVIDVATPVEHHPAYSFRLGTFGDRFADFARGGGVPAAASLPVRLSS